MLGAAVQCWSFLIGLPKLLKLKARFPFFVRQVFKFCLFLTHVCKVSHPKGAQNGPQNDPNSHAVYKEFARSM